jgi:hypothetical protein
MQRSCLCRLIKARLQLLGPLPERARTDYVKKSEIAAAQVATSDSDGHGDEEEEALEIEIVGAGGFLKTGSVVKGDMTVLFTMPSGSVVVLERTTFSGMIGHGTWPTDIEVRLQLMSKV